jgi:hypothetical protein
VPNSTGPSAIDGSRYTRGKNFVVPQVPNRVSPADPLLKSRGERLEHLLTVLGSFGPALNELDDLAADMPVGGSTSRAVTESDLVGFRGGAETIFEPVLGRFIARLVKGRTSRTAFIATPGSWSRNQASAGILSGAASSTRRPAHRWKRSRLTL